MKSTKELIDENAINLFATNGFHNVSMRDIAASIGISLGNLQYYYPKKEQLISSIYVTIVDEFIENIEKSIDMEDYSLLTLVGFFHKASENRLNYAHYFRNIVELNHAYKTIKDMHTELYSHIFDYIQTTLNKLQDDGLVSKNLSSEQKNNLTCIILYLMVFWSQYGAPIYHDLPYEPDFFQSLMGLLEAHLTEAGCKELAGVKKFLKI